MTAVTAPATVVPGVTLPRIVRSEWTKFWSVRSTRWSLLVATVLTIGFPLLVSAVISAHWGSQSPDERASFDPIGPALIGSLIAQLAIGVLGVLVITAEYSTGMIRASLSAVPKRLPMLWGKAIVFAGVTLGLMVPSLLIAFFASQSILSRHHASYGWGHPGVPRVVLGAAVYLAIVGIFALGLGTILRNTAGGIASFAAIFFVLPPLMNVLPASWNDAISPYLPSNAGSAFLSLTRDSSNSLAPWTGLAVFAGWAALMLALGAVLLKRRDA